MSDATTTTTTTTSRFTESSGKVVVEDWPPPGFRQTLEGLASRCNLYNKTVGGAGGSGGSQNPFGIVNNYGGIPQNLLTNVIAATVLVLIFVFLRKSAWKVLNKILTKDDVEKWSNVFYSFRTHPGEISSASGHQGGEQVTRGEAAVHPGVGAEVYAEKLDHQADAEDGRETHLHDNPENGAASLNGDGAIRSNSPPVQEEIKDAVAEEEGPPSDTIGLNPDGKGRLTRHQSVCLPGDASMAKTVSFYDWLKSIFTTTDDVILEKCGEDSLQYLRFQRHIISYLMFVMVLSVCVILPLNFQGTLQGDATSFEHTTLVNLEPDSPYLWVHISLAFFFFPVSIVVMRRFSVRLNFTEVSLEISRTIMIENIPKNLCNTDKELFRYFQEAFPKCTISDLRFAYDVQKLTTVAQDLKAVKSASRYCERNRELKREEVYLYPKQCSRYSKCFCCCCHSQVDGVEYYGGEYERLMALYENEKEASFKEPLGMAFVTFSSYNMSKEVHDAFKKSWYSCCNGAPDACLSTILQTSKWTVSYAPEPEDIYWENLGSSNFFLLKLILVNVALFIFTLFLTTPEVLLTQVNNIGSKLGFSKWATSLRLPPAIVDFIPTLMIWSFTALLPLLVSWSDRYLGHWTRSKENHTIMKKTFWYLLFMVVMLPTFGFTSAEAGLQFLFQQDRNDTYRWECVFLPDSGAFFVNYAITAAFVGCGLELIRLPDLIWYAVQVFWSKSKAETAYIRSTTKYEFRFGEQYARMIMLFCMTMMYCVSCPMITPFGTLYFVIKHYVDRHNLLYAYRSSKINKAVHSTAISFVVLSTVILQFFMMVFTIIRGGMGITQLSLMSKFAICFFLISVNILSAQLWSSTCKKFSPIEYVECTYIRDSEVEARRDRIYLPEVLMTHDERIRFQNYLKSGEKREDPMKKSNIFRRHVTSERNSGHAETASKRYGTF